MNLFLLLLIYVYFLVRLEESVNTSGFHLNKQLIQALIYFTDEIHGVLVFTHAVKRVS